MIGIFSRILPCALLCLPAFAYDPLDLPASQSAATADLSIEDGRRDREIPVRIYLPEEKSPAPVVLFSHGLGGSREGSSFLGRHWAGRGYVAIFLQHPGSDSSVWKDKPMTKRMDAMREAAGADGARNFLLRVGDVSAVLDQLGKWNKEEGHLLSGRLDFSRIGMSGHSFGAITTQAVSGQKFASDRISTTDSRIKAAVVFSPSSPQFGKAEEAFGSVNIPWMLMTGTKDVAIIGNADMKSRLAVFPSLPPGSKYELVLFEAEHSAFTERPLPGESGKRNPKHHVAIKALSTAFWDAYLKDSPEARKWLDGDGPAEILDKKDSWKKK